jgi:hypothetical protein
MAKANSTTAKNLLGVVQLLEQIVTAFDDAYSRPQREIALYEKYLELSQTYEVRLAGRFMVITGSGNGGKSPTEQQRTERTRKKAIHLNAATLTISSEGTTKVPS